GGQTAQNPVASMAPGLQKGTANCLKRDNSTLPATHSSDTHTLHLFHIEQPHPPTDCHRLNPTTGNPLLDRVPLHPEFGGDLPDRHRWPGRHRPGDLGTMVDRVAGVARQPAVVVAHVGAVSAAWAAVARRRWDAGETAEPAVDLPYFVVAVVGEFVGAPPRPCFGEVAGDPVPGGRLFGDGCEFTV